jgi:hypothetical protein
MTSSPLSGFRGAALAAILFAAAGGVLFWPTLQPGRWAFGTDTISHDLIAEAYGWSLWRQQQGQAGTLPWFGPHLRTGQPLQGSLAWMPFYPPNWLTGAAIASAGDPWEGASWKGPSSAPLDTPQVAAIFLGDGWNLPRAHALQWPLHLALGAWFLFLAIRARGGSWLAGILGGLIFGFSGHVATLTHAGHLAKVQAIAWLPAMVWALEVAAQRRHSLREGTGRGHPWVPLLAASGALSMMWLAGHPQIWAYAAALMLALETARGKSEVRSQKSKGKTSAFNNTDLISNGYKKLASLLSPRRSARAIQTIAWGARSKPQDQGANKRPKAPSLTPENQRPTTNDQRPLLGLGRALAIAALSLLLAAPMSLAVAEFAPVSNRAAQTSDEALKSSYPPEELWELAIPRMAGDSVAPAFGGTGTYRGRWGERIVSDYLGLPVLLLTLAGICFGARRSRWFWAAVFGATAVFCLGGYLGRPYGWFLEAVPGLKMFRSSATLMVLLPLSAGMLAADGLDALRGGRSARGGRFSRRRAWVFGMGATLLLGATLSPLPRWTWEALAGQEFSETQLQAHQASKRHVAMIAGAAVLLGLGWLALRLRFADSRRGALVLTGATLALVAGDLFATTRFFIRPAPVDVFRGAVEFHRALSELREDFIRQRGGREPGLPPSLHLPGRELSLWPMLAGWRVPRGYHPIAYETLEGRMRASGADPERFHDETGVRAVIERDRVLWRETGPFADADALNADALGGARGDFRLSLPPAPDGSWLLALPGDGAWRIAADAGVSPSGDLFALAGLTLESQGLATRFVAPKGAPPKASYKVALEFAPSSKRFGLLLMALAWAGLLASALFLNRRNSESKEPEQEPSCALAHSPKEKESESHSH